MEDRSLVRCGLANWQNRKGKEIEKSKIHGFVLQTDTIKDILAGHRTCQETRTLRLNINGSDGLGDLERWSILSLYV